MGMTIVDALVVTLGLDTAAFKRGKSEASSATKKLTAEERKAAKDIEEQNKKAADSFRRLRTEVLALAAIFTAGVGIKEFAESTINGAANLGFMAKNLQMSTRDLSAWQRAAQRAGGSAEGITAALQASQGDVSKLKFGQMTEGVQWFLRMGGSAKDLKDGNSYLLARSRIIKQMFDVDPGRARFVAQAMGIGDDEFNFLKQGPQAVLALVDAQKKNSAITEEQAKRALELKNEWLDVRDRLQYVGTTILLDLMPTFEKWIGQLQKASDWVAAHKGDISEWLDEANKDVSKFVEMANDAAQAVGGWKNVIVALGALKILSIAMPLFRLASALGGVGGGLARIATSGPGALVALGLVAEEVRKLAFDKAIPAGPNHDQYVAEAQAGGAVTPNVDQPPPGGFGKLGAWLKKSFGTSEAARQKQAMDYFISQGWSPAQAAGIAGSLTQESHLDPTARNPASGALGIGQWLGSRVGDFRKFAGHGLEESTFEEQLAFMQYELTKGKEQAAGRALRAALTPAQAAAIHSSMYERPGAAEANIANRRAYANILYSTIGQQNAAQIAGQTAAAGVPAPRVSTSTSTSHAETHVNGPINIHTQATDAAGIAREFGNAVKRYSFMVPQANTGMS